ncbi:MAG: magnesium transporter [Verrucomicrobia bacterium]|nr:magnesium transporter [Verrucomicrobiota bacterium]
MIGNIIKPELIELIRQRGFTKLRDVLTEFEPVELAEILGDFEPNEQAVFLRLLPKETAADVFEFFDLDTQECLLEALGRDQLAELLNEMDPDDRTAILEELPDNVSSRLLDLLNPSERKIADELLGYPEGSIGRIMIPEYVEIKSSWKVQDVLNHLRNCGDKKESLHQLYVTDTMGKLIGLLRLRNLVIAPLNTDVSELLDSQIISLNATDKQEVAVTIFQKYDRTVLPVTDTNSCLVGVVTVDDIMDVAEEEVTEDFQKMGGMEALEAPYLSLPVFQMIRKRGGWLVILFFGQQLTVFAMEHIKGDLDKMIYLISFLPLIISSGGNTGSQTSTLIIRALATHEVSLQDTWKVLVRELLTSFGLGLILALLSFSLIFVFKSHFESAYLSVALIISFSLLGVVTLGGLIGGIFPFLLSKLKFDPAVCSSPFVTTLIDVSGLLIYFQIARLFMP